MGLIQVPSSPPMPPCTTQLAVQRILNSPQTLISQLQELPGHLHNLHTIRLSDGSCLILKTNPSSHVCLLRTEQNYLESEAAVLELLLKSNLPTPRFMCYERMQRLLMSPCLLTGRLSGTSYADIRQYLPNLERTSIERQIEIIRVQLARYTSNRFGQAGIVRLGNGCKTWREAFTNMTESLLMDGEDIMVNIPYFAIREAISRWESYLDDVTEARLVVPDLSKPENVLIDRKSNMVTGVLDFGGAVWGDVAMTKHERADDIKSLLYTCYTCVLTIVKNHYRYEGDDQELEARKCLTSALKGLSPERFCAVTSLG